MSPIGWRALTRWQAIVVARAAAFAPLYWIAWMVFWTIRGWARP